MASTKSDDLSPQVPDGLLRLVSGDGFSFIIEEEYAMVSTVIRAMMRSSFRESITRVIHLPEIRGRVLEKICQYFYYIPRFQSRQKLATTLPKNVLETTGMSPMDSFAENFDVPQELSLELYLGAKYLDL